MHVNSSGGWTPREDGQVAGAPRVDPQQHHQSQQSGFKEALRQNIQQKGRTPASAQDQGQSALPLGKEQKKSAQPVQANRSSASKRDRGTAGRAADGNAQAPSRQNSGQIGRSAASGSTQAPSRHDRGPAGQTAAGQRQPPSRHDSSPLQMRPATPLDHDQRPQGGNGRPITPLDRDEGPRGKGGGPTGHLEMRPTTPLERDERHQGGHGGSFGQGLGHDRGNAPTMEAAMPSSLITKSRAELPSPREVPIWVNRSNRSWCFCVGGDALGVLVSRPKEFGSRVLLKRFAEIDAKSFGPVCVGSVLTQNSAPSVITDGRLGDGHDRRHSRMLLRKKLCGYCCQIYWTFGCVDLNEDSEMFPGSCVLGKAERSTNMMQESPANYASRFRSRGI